MSAASSNSSRTAIVSGASRGIGRAIAVGLAGRGMGIAINYHANRSAAEEAAALVEQAGGRALLVQADVAQDEDRARLLQQTVAELGPVDLLVNNAGVAPKVRADLLEATPESFDAVLATNLKGPYFLSQIVARHMLEQPDRPNRSIVNIGSISAYAASINRGEYCVAKAGMAMMTALFATRLAEAGINVYEVRPGIIETDMTAAVKQKYDRLILEQGLTPIRRWGRPEDIARAVVAIAEGAFAYSTGEVINVDGGFHLHRL